MTRLPDYRADRMESPEGAGVALNRRLAWMQSIPGAVRTEAATHLDGEVAISDLGPVFDPLLNESMLEECELIGFWVAWHRAGGFAGLEGCGWHRATIFRKIRSFRAYFGDHPDTHRFPWIRLDLNRAWNRELDARLTEIRG